MHIGRNHFLADPFDEVRRSLDYLSRIFVGFEYRAIRIGTNYSDVGILFLEKSSRTRDRATSPYPGDEVCDFAVSLFPNFGTRRAVVGFRVGRMRLLIWIK